MGKENVKGLSIALVDGSRIVWTQGFGEADHDRPATPETRYALGGLSRVFTAAEVLTLADKGKIQLDRSIQKDIPGFRIQSRFKKANPITPRALLADHSGLPGFFLKGLWVKEPEVLSDLVQELGSDHLYEPPQSRYRYSYTDYDLLGRLIELKRKRPFDEAIQLDLLNKLGMSNSAFESPVPGGITARGHLPDGADPLAHLRDIPAAGMMSSATDLGKFMTFLLGEGIDGPRPPRWLKTYFAPQFKDRPLDFGHVMGCSWNLSGFPVEGEETAWCDGTYPGYFASMTLLKEDGLGVVLLSNSMEAGKIADDLTQRALKLALQVKRGIKLDLEKKKIEMPPVVEISKETLQSYSGIYSALGQVAPIGVKEKCLDIDFQGHNLDLLPVSQATFIPHLMFLIFPVDLPQYPLTFAQAAGESVALLGGFHFPIPLERISPVEIRSAWKEREGDYELDNSDGQLDFSRIQLTEKAGFLTVDLKVSFKALGIKDMEFKVALLALSDEDAMIPGLFYGDGGTLHAEEGTARVYYSGYWFKKVPAQVPVQPTPRPEAK